jgi:excisionase family DNA binding protein
MKISEGGYEVKSGTENLVTVKEAASMLNVSERTIWKYVQRRTLKASRKFSEGRKPKVMVFQDSISELLRSRSDTLIIEGSMNNSKQGQDTSGKVQNASGIKASIPLEHYEEQRSRWLQERDQMQAGLMMYRHKYEEAEQKLRLLPAPPEIILPRLSDLEQKETALVQAQKILKQAQEVKERYKESILELRKKLLEEEQVREKLAAELQEAKRPWWKKLLGAK